MESYVTDCLLKPRGGENHLFEVKANGEVLARLKGYAIVPIEEYLSLIHAEQNLTRIGLTLSETPQGLRWQVS